MNLASVISIHDFREIRNIVWVVPRFRSHILVRATKKTDPSQDALDALRKCFDSLGILRPPTLLHDRTN
jgi:hypothetical protein